MNNNTLTLKIKNYQLQLRICIKQKIDYGVFYNLISYQIVYFIYSTSQPECIIIDDFRELYIKLTPSDKLNYKKI